MKPRELPPSRDAAPLLPWLLAALAPMPRSKVKKLLGSGSVHVNGESVTQFDHALKPGDRVCLGAVRRATLPVMFEDDSLIIIDKPAGLLTVATETEKEETAFRKVEAMLPMRPGVVHRLDRETSGLLLFAKSPAIREHFQTHWDTVEKTYFAVVQGQMPVLNSGTVVSYLREGKSLKVTSSPHATPGSKLARTAFRTLKTNVEYSLIEAILKTGRKHQIRVHLASIGCPVIGDALHGATANPARRLGLHAHRLAFPHPVTGERITVESPLPTALARIV